MVPIRTITQSFKVTKAAMLQQKDQQDIEARNDDTHDKRDVEKELKRDRRADNFGKITGCNRDLREQPQRIDVGRL